MKKLSKTSPRFRGFLLAPLKKKKKKKHREPLQHPQRKTRQKKFSLKNFSTGLSLQVNNTNNNSIQNKETTMINRNNKSVTTEKIAKQSRRRLRQKQQQQKQRCKICIGTALGLTCGEHGYVSQKAFENEFP
jgi:hypothetical protein